MVTPLRVLFAGTPEFAAVHLRALLAGPHEVCAVLTQPDRKSGRGKKVLPSPVKTVAVEAGIDVLQPLTLKEASNQAMLAAYNADVMVVVAYGLILPQAVLDIPRFGCLNVHASILPRWRGAAPIQRAIEAGDPESGVTIMAMEAGLDTGPMLEVASLSIPPGMTGGALHDQLAELGPPALEKVLSDLPAALAGGITQKDQHANYAHKISKAEMAIDWRQPAETLARKIRAFSPAPGCYSELSGQRVKIWAADVEPTPTDAPPGTLLAADKNGLWVACGEQQLRILEAQVPGGKALPIAALLNGQRALFTPNHCFDLPEPE